MKRFVKRTLTLLLVAAVAFSALFFLDGSGFQYALEREWALSGLFARAGDSVETLAGTGDGAKSPARAGDGTGKLLEEAPEEEPVNTGEEYSFDGELYPYYEMLSSAQKAVYRQIYANAMVQNASFSLVEAVTQSEFADAVSAVYNDHPELFWLETTYSYSYIADGQVVSMKLYYYLTGTELEAAQTAFDSAVQTLVAQASAYTTQIEQELYVHDAINEMTVYDEAADMNQSAYSALVNGRTVCAGYARAFQCVMQELGYVAYYCTGTADGGDHAWNLIQVEGEFYNVDLTWDDCISEAYGSRAYTYFNLTDSAISVDHTRSTLSSKLPSCTSTAMAYTTVYGDTISIGDIELEGAHTDGNMIITPSAPEITDWKDAPQAGGSDADSKDSPGAQENRTPEEGQMPGGSGGLDGNQMPDANQTPDGNQMPDANQTFEGNRMPDANNQTMPGGPSSDRF